MTAPIIVADRDGNVTLYASVDAAEGDIESIDVDAGEYSAFDSEGRRLVIEVQGQPGRARETELPFGLRALDSLPVRIRAAEDVPGHEEELIRILTSALGTPGGAAGRAELPALVALAVATLPTCGYRRSQ